jgi:LacI family transcriptional regulator
MDRAAQKAGRYYSGIKGIAMQDASLQESMGAIVDRSRGRLVSTDIAIVQDRKNKYMVEQLILGASQAFEKKGLVFTNFIEIPREYRSSYTYLKDYFKTHKHQLVIAHRDSQAMAVINAAAENEIKIPSEMEVVCVIDTKYNSMVRPQISSFAIPSYDLGAVAMRVMTKMLNQSPVDEKEIELSYLFTPRQSTK